MAQDSTPPVVLLAREVLDGLLAWSRDSVGGLGLDDVYVAALEKRVRAYADLVKLGVQPASANTAHGSQPPGAYGAEFLEEFLEWSGDSIGGLGLAWDQAEALSKRVRAYGDLATLAEQQTRLARPGGAVGGNNSAMGQTDGEYCEFHGSPWPCETCTRLGDMSRCECIQLGFYGTVLCRYHEGIAEGRRQVEEATAPRTEVPGGVVDTDIPVGTGSSDSGEGWGMLVDEPGSSEVK